MYVCTECWAVIALAPLPSGKFPGLVREQLTRPDSINVDKAK